MISVLGPLSELIILIVCRWWSNALPWSRFPDVRQLCNLMEDYFFRATCFLKKKNQGQLFRNIILGLVLWNLWVWIWIRVIYYSSEELIWWTYHDQCLFISNSRVVYLLHAYIIYWNYGLSSRTAYLNYSSLGFICDSTTSFALIRH